MYVGVSVYVLNLICASPTCGFFKSDSPQKYYSDVSTQTSILTPCRPDELWPLSAEHQAAQ